MAFTTQQGTGGAPWTFLGTPEADTIAVITGSTQDSNAFDFIAEGFEGNDVINFNGTRSVTIKGGQGEDLITNNVAASAGLTSIISSSFINGNDGADRIGNTELGLLATLSTVSGGQGEDKLYIGSLQSSKVNGNLGADFLEVGDVGFDENIVGTLSNFNAASVFGGQGADAIRVRSDVRAFTNSQVNGQIGDDFIQIQIGRFDLATAIEDDLAFGFDPENGILSSPTTTGTTFDGGDGEDILDASGLLLDIRQGGRVEIDGDVNRASGSDLDLFGGEGNDSMFGGIGEDLVAGDNGDDWLAGYGNRDEVIGGNGDDVIIGAYFDGQLSAGFVGDAAGDTLSGGNGSNTFFVPGTGSAFISGFVTNPLGSTGFVTLTEPLDDALVGQISNGDLLAVNFGADVITDWTAGDNVLNTGLADSLEAAFDGSPAMSFGFDYDGVPLQNYAVRGFYTERFNELGEFTVSEFGTDIAVWTNYSGTDVFDGLDPADGFSFDTFVDNLTILKNVPTTAFVSANQFVADL